MEALNALEIPVDVVSVGGTPLPANAQYLPHARLHTIRRPPIGGPAFFALVHQGYMGMLKSITAQVIHASDLYALPAARSAARRQKARLTYDARELYPFVSATTGRPFVSSAWRHIEASCVPDCDAVFTVNDSIAHLIRFAYDTVQPVVLRNAPSAQASDRTNLLRNTIGISARSPIVLHLGQLRHGRGCEVLVQAFEHVPGAHLVFLGAGPLRVRLRGLTGSLGLNDRIHFMNPVPPGAVLDFAASADVGAVLLEDSCLNHHFALPNKLFEYLTASVPVLASDLPELRRIVRGFDVGLTACPGDPQDIGRKLRQMLADPVQLSRWQSNTRRVQETFAPDATSERFVQVVNDLLRTS